MEKPILQDSPSFVDLCTLHQHAMRYYRLWIYACNTVLALATLIFSVFAVSVLVDPRLSLLSGVELYQPTFLYAYVALLLQCGVLQAIGCIGALRLNQRLLNTYWTLLLVLMIGDILVGLVWAFRLDQIKSNLKPMLKKKLITLYGKDQKFTDVWNWVHGVDGGCCGVEGPSDFLLVNESALGPLDMNSLANDTWFSYLALQQDRLQNQDFIPKLPSTCCIFTVTPLTSSVEPPTQPENRGLGWGDRGGGSSSSSSSSAETRRILQKTRIGGGFGKLGGGDRWNDPMSRIPVPGFYHEEPQQLKGMYYSGNLNKDANNNLPDESSILNHLKLNNAEDSRETFSPASSSSGSNNNNSSSSSRNNNNMNSSSRILGKKLVVSDLRQQPLVTDPYPNFGTPMGYFGTGGMPPPPISPISGTHNRRKISHAKNKGYDEYGYGYMDRRGYILPKMTTTSSPPPGKPSPATIGVCVLPSHLQETASAIMSSSKPLDSESGEDSFEFSSTTTTTATTSSLASSPSSSATTTTTAAPATTSTKTNSPITSTYTTESHPVNVRSSTVRETATRSHSLTTAVPISQSVNSEEQQSASSSKEQQQQSQRKRQQLPFTVSMEQHTDGCGDKILEWVEHSADVLFVIGFCIIVFLKGCFIAILRYEIKEMIEKIKLLNGEDGGNSAAMNELIGMTSTYEATNEDGAGEREGLMSDVHNNNQDTSYSNQDTIGGGNNAGGSGNALTVSSSTIRNCDEDETLGRKDSKANHNIGNKTQTTTTTTMTSILGQSGSGPRQIGNHIGYGTRDREKHEIEDDFDSGSALLGDHKHPFGESPPLIDINKHSPQFFPRGGGGTRDSGVVLTTAGGFPKNGNNNNSSNVSSCTVPSTRTNVDDVRVSLSSPIILQPHHNANATSTSSH